MEHNPQISKSFWVKLLLIPVSMFCFAFALVPLYDVLCNVTGFNGTTGNISSATAKAYVIDENWKVKIDFVASVAAGLPIEFQPEARKIEIIPGKVYTVYYSARNTTDRTIVGQAVPSVAPSRAALHFKKLACFCFDRQSFAAYEKIDLPVQFVVDPGLDKTVKNITLSYNFFKI